jgi:hypothetical protein
VHAAIERDIGPEDPDLLNGIGEQRATPSQ